MFDAHPWHACTLLLVMFHRCRFIHANLHVSTRSADDLCLLLHRISIDGHTEISFTEDVAARFVALGWHVQHVKDGNTDLAGLRAALDAAKADPRPSFIKARFIGFSCFLSVTIATGLFKCPSAHHTYSAPQQDDGCCPAPPPSSRHVVWVFSFLY